MLYLTDQKRRKKVKCIVLVYIHFQDGQFSPSKGISNEIYILFSARKASCFPIFTIKTQVTQIGFQQLIESVGSPKGS